MKLTSRLAVCAYFSLMVMAAQPALAESKCSFYVSGYDINLSEKLDTLGSVNELIVTFLTFFGEDEGGAMVSRKALYAADSAEVPNSRLNRDHFQAARWLHRIPSEFQIRGMKLSVKEYDFNDPLIGRSGAMVMWSGEEPVTLVDMEKWIFEPITTIKEQLVSADGGVMGTRLGHKFEQLTNPPSFSNELISVKLQILRVCR